VGRNPSKKNKSHFIAVVLHPEDAKDIVSPRRVEEGAKCCRPHMMTHSGRAISVEA
jgi:hypothetical protein